MGRPAKFDSDEMLAAAARLVALGGPASATVAGIAGELGAPTGSIYHRFESRDLLLARLWIRAVKDAQHGFVDALARPDVADAATAAALHIPRWCRRNLDLARVLILHRREDLVDQWPDELGGELETLNDDVSTALRSYTSRRCGRAGGRAQARVMFALVDVPYGAVRRHLVAGVAPPPQVDELVRATCDCILGPAS